MRSRAAVERDQEASVFGRILARLCNATGAVAAALVDSEGETVDYAGRLEAYDIKIAAAEWRLALDCVREFPVFDWRRVTEMIVRARHMSYFTVGLGDGYALVIALPRHAFKVSRRAVSEAVRELSREGGLDGSEDVAAGERWAWVQVRTADAARLRPVAIWRQEQWLPLTILGRYRSADLQRSEVGYRVRVADGAELALVREPLGQWFADEP